MNMSQSPAEIAHDLFHIHQDRVVIYKSILTDLKHVEADVRALFERMIEESIECARELTSYAPKITDLKGDIYKMWKRPVEVDVLMDKKAIAKICADDELALVNTYSIALSSIVSESELEALLLSQQQKTMGLYNHLLQFHDAQ